MKISVSNNIICNVGFIIISLFFTILSSWLLKNFNTSLLGYILSIPCFLAYLAFIIFFIKKVKFIRFLIYPLTGSFILNIISAMIAPVLVKNNATTGILLSIIGVAFWVIVIGSFIFGLIKDTPEIEEYKKNLEHKNTKINNIIFFAVSLAFILYFVFVVYPFANAHGFFSEYNAPYEAYISTYFWITTPVYVSYIIYLIFSFLKIKYVRFLAYPIMSFILYFGFFYCLLFMGGAVMWFMVYTIIPFLIIPLACLVIGLIKDIPEIKNYYNRT